MIRFATVAALLLPGVASAQDHLGQIWRQSDLPLEYEVSTYVEDSLPPDYDMQAMIQRAYDQWTNYAPCSGVGGTFVGFEEVNLPYRYDLRNMHSFDDPGDALAPGVLAATLNLPQGSGSPIELVRNGRTYTRILDSDIVFNDNVNWSTEAEVDTNTCDGFPIVNTTVHEIGHQFGLAHTCEQGEVCNEAERLDATMHWTQTGPTCSLQRSIPNSLDIQNITSLYGAFAQFECSHELDPGNETTIAVGNVPFELQCRMITDAPDDVTGATWYFGDGGVDESVDGTHTYTEAGNYTVRVCFDFEQESCGATQYCFRREGYVRACDVPTAEFSMEHEDGLTWQFLNTTDLSVYGCIFEVQWDIFKLGESEPIASLAAWEPRFTFPEAGEYRVVLNVGGPAGTGAAELLVKPRNRADGGYSGCDSGLAGSAIGGSGVLLAAALLRRRKR